MFNPMAKLDQSEQPKSSPTGKDAPAPPAHSDIKEAQDFFAGIMKKESAFLPNVKFDVTAVGTDEHKTYVLKESIQDKNSRVTTTREMGSFHDDGHGKTSSSALESVIMPDGSVNLRKTEIDTDAAANQVTKTVLQGPRSDLGMQPLFEMSHSVTTPNGSVESTFSYADKSGQPSGETTITTGKDFSRTTQQFAPDGKGNLRPTSEVSTSADGTSSVTTYEYSGKLTTETVSQSRKDGSTSKLVFQGQDSDLQEKSSEIVSKNGDTDRTRTEDILNDKKEKVGVRKTDVSFDHQDKTTTSTVFEGAPGDELKAKSMTVTGPDGTVLKRFEVGADGRLHQKN